MPNLQTINGAAVNTAVPSQDTSIDTYSFDGFGLQNGNIITGQDGLSIRDYPTRDISIVDRPQSDGGIYNNSLFRGRTFTIKGILFEPLCSDLCTLIDNFKLRLSGKNKIFKWKTCDDVRTIYATVESLRFDERDVNIIPYEITFKSQDSYFLRQSGQSHVETDVSSLPLDISINNQSLNAFPFAVINFKSVTTQVTSITLTSNSIGLVITENINQGDILIIDGENKKIFLNGVQILLYDGVFPIFETGTNQVQLEITGSDVLVDIQFIYDYKML